MESCSSRTGLSVLLPLQEDIGLSNHVQVQGYKNRDPFDWRDKTLHHIFNSDSGCTSFLSDDDEDMIDSKKIKSFLEMVLLQHKIEEEINPREGMEITNISGLDNDDAFVTVTKMSGAGDMKIIQRRRRGGVVIESQDAFCSICANACVSRGKWMYEVTLETSGIQQLGWATQKCIFTREEGVGDSQDSYAYDGKRVRKWCVSWYPYGQPWVQGDVIGCLIDLEKAEISFSRNGTSLGIAFTEVGNLPYYPAISLSRGERCDLNFGGKPFRYPVEGFQPIQAPPIMSDGMYIFPALSRAQFLLAALQRLLQLESKEVIASMTPIERLKRPKPLGKESTILVGQEICRPLALLLILDSHTFEYVIWGALVPFLMELYQFQPPHDVASVEIVLEMIFSFLDSRSIRGCICEIMEALAFGCRTSPIKLVQSPYTGSYPYLALATHLIQRRDHLTHWCSSETFELCLEGFFSRKAQNKYDLEKLMPTVWWPGSRDDLCTENNMRQTSQALSKAIGKVEELQWEISHFLLEFVPVKENNLFADSEFPKASLMHPSGSVFMSFLRHLICKNKGAAKNILPPGLSDNSVLMTVYTVLLRFLSKGYTTNNIKTMGKDEDAMVGFLHRGGKRSFRVQLFLDADSYVSDFTRLGGTFTHLSKAHNLAPSDYNAIIWEEGCMEEESERKFTHQGKQKPCCCAGILGNPSNCNKGFVQVLNKGFNIHADSVRESNGTSRPQHVGRNICTDHEEEKTSSSGRAEPIFQIPLHHHHHSQKKSFTSKTFLTSDAVCEDELFDIMVMLYHLGVTPNFKQASYFSQHQLQVITQLDDTERQIRSEKTSNELVKRLKEARSVYRDDLIECVRQSTWYKVSLFSKWKQKGMFATCMWIVQFLLVLSDNDSLFSFVPEYYVETLLDCFHALRRSEPLFVSPAALLQQGLSPLITFLVTHFNDTRIANLDIRDALLQSISVLMQYKEHVVAFESNAAATSIMPATLLSSFDNRFWIPVTNILLRLCKGTGFGCSKSSTHGESCSLVFQKLLRKKCVEDEKLFSSFLNRLFNTLNWTITEWSVSMRDIREQSGQHQVTNLQQRKCSIMFELSCNLERVLEFFTRELPQAFLCGSEVNLVRLCEFMMFVLNHTASIAESTLRQQGNSLDKVNRAMILAPLVGIILNLSKANVSNQHARHDLALTILNIDVSSVATKNFESLSDFNWAMSFKGDPSLAKLPNLLEFVTQLKKASAANERECEDDSFATTLAYDHEGQLYWELERGRRERRDFNTAGNNGGNDDEDICSICYACEVNTIFSPCNHKSCSRCISRHLLNNQRCFFCNATIGDLYSMSATHSPGHNQIVPDGTMGESGPLMKIDSS